MLSAGLGCRLLKLTTRKPVRTAEKRPAYVTVYLLVGSRPRTSATNGTHKYQDTIHFALTVFRQSVVFFLGRGDVSRPYLCGRVDTFCVISPLLVGIFQVVTSILRKLKVIHAHLYTGTPAGAVA